MAFVLMDIFLQKNGWEITASEEEAYVMVMQLADGKMNKAHLVQWIKEHSTRFGR